MPDSLEFSNKEAWHDIWPGAKPDPGNWPIHYIIYYFCKQMMARETLEIGIGQRPSGTYMMGLHAKEVGGRHTGIDVSTTCISRARMIVEKFDLPVDILQCDSKAVVWLRRLDLCYVDGGHTYDQVVGDINRYSPFIKRNGLMIFDDYGKKHLQVTEAVDDLYDEELWDMLYLPHLRWVIWRRK